MMRGRRSVMMRRRGCSRACRCCRRRTRCRHADDLLCFECASVDDMDKGGVLGEYHEFLAGNATKLDTSHAPTRCFRVSTRPIPWVVRQPTRRRPSARRYGHPRLICLEYLERFGAANVPYRHKTFLRCHSKLGPVGRESGGKGCR